MLTAQPPSTPCRYSPDVEDALTRISAALNGSYRLSKRAMALLLLQDDPEIAERVQREEGVDRALAVALDARASMDASPDLTITLRRRDVATAIAHDALTRPLVIRVTTNERLSRLCTSPITGVPILVAVLWLGLYQFVGIFGGGTVVGWLEKGIFGTYINPAVTHFIQRLLPWPWLSSLFVGEYGVWTLGVTYAIALIFPIVGTFFLAFSVLEDSGYFPRLAMLIDRLFKGLGLNGKAVIPIVLGFGCDTMATIVTRILETRRERIIATFLLSLAIPCSAQIGVMTALLSNHAMAFWLWGAIMGLIFVVIGWLTAQLLPGEPARFAMELPPLRFPSLSNIATKTFARMQWYFMEVFPLFVLASFAIWLGQLTRLFDLLVAALVPVTHLLGLPNRAAEAFLFGFFRRDYGAAGLYRIQQSGALNGNQLLVSVVTLTIFLPCVAQFLMMKRERGLKTSLLMAAFIFPFAVAVGAMLNESLMLFHVHL
jgi:ferrous iron transport protein B